MTNDLLGSLIRDRRSGLVGRVVGRVTWLDSSPLLVIQPPARDDRTVPPTAYVNEASAELVPETPPEPRLMQ